MEISSYIRLNIKTLEMKINNNAKH